MLYEINYLVLQSKTDQLDKIRQSVKDLIESQGAKFDSEKNYLKRKLAYEIKHENYGFFTVVRFELEDTQKATDIKRELNLNPNICRYVMVKADELPSLDQATMQKEETVEAAVTAEAEKASETLKDIAQQPMAEPQVKAKETVAAEAVIEEKVIAEETAPEAKETAVKDTSEKPAAVEAEKVQAAKDQPSKDEKSAAKEKQDDKASLDELDKKLDEILNI